VTTTTASYQIRNELQDAPTEQAIPDVMKTLLLAYEVILEILRVDLKVAILTEPQWRVLHELRAKSPMIASELAANTFVRASSLSRILRDLERRDLVSRTQQFEDLRKTLVSITDYGRRSIEPIEAKYADLLIRMTTVTGRQDIDQCMQTCLTLVRELESGVDLGDE
jgi:DNA-binding MarR family transcriptional regulator